ncbi:DUF2254 domain-containing protein [Myxococcus qinghaiensis]|uniref:DUF2254 domain-containing protein n=1 Tax=Myxococcus qinghaiensis TaxID=2906758 RepID=UPI0020A75901|nr:DUF2254 family protein [Myxococcus qinghaiensis]MCP3161829.1 DUF2254 domain-containing protein [Myxococcus qinghaiensis]
MVARRLRRLIRDPYWLLLLAALLAGGLLGLELARIQWDTASAFFGQAWRGDPSETRSALTALFGLQITVLTVVLSLNAPVIQSAANQYSPRLVPLYLKSAPLRRAIPLFCLSSGYIIVSVRELGLIADEAVRPRPVLSAAFILVFCALMALVLCLIRTFRYMRVERVLGLVQDLVVSAAEQRIRARLRGLLLDPIATLMLPPESLALTVRSSGYLTEVDLRRLTRLAREWSVRTRIDALVGDYVDAGSVVGWVVPEAPGQLDPRAMHDLATSLILSPVREPDCDPALGIRILVDVANRALSSSSNDAYTARQALQQVRSVLRRLGHLPLGDWNVVDPDGRVRASVAGMRLRDYLFLAVDGPLHHAMGSPEVIEEVLQIALAVGMTADDEEDRGAAQALVTRVLSEAATQEPPARERLHRLLTEARRVRASFALDPPRGDDAH